ncbi:hypothetical protein [Nitrosomonas eutropha]|uniref:hypothetical protein n=1 Tax=Nitrosomonas eutropha TaxID=916 RepID=UPI000325B9FF|nr:hypothetical protein [Nitrosomonas eutropha]
MRKAAASPPEKTGSRSRVDAVRTGVVTRQVSRRNLKDQWLPGMSLTTSAIMG